MIWIKDLRGISISKIPNKGCWHLGLTQIDKLRNRGCTLQGLNKDKVYGRMAKDPHKFSQCVSTQWVLSN